MEANEVPEKIYIGIVPSDLGNYTYTTVGKDFPDAIKYIRADAFIEKACDYLNKTCRKFILTEKDIEDFKNYMEGE